MYHVVFMMSGEEMRSLRLTVGLSQSALADAIGMSRQSIGRMERGSERVEKRTELAVRYVAEVGLPSEPTLGAIHDQVARVLDDAAVRAVPSIERTQKLKKALDDWLAAKGSDKGRHLLYRAQGVIGMINVTEARDPLWPATMRDLRQLKLEWAEIRP
jgi:DNA-binding XRE family transcriptional regulator